MNLSDVRQLDSALLAGVTGSVVQTIGLTAAVADFPVPIGALVAIEKQSGEQMEAEVVGFRDKQTLVMPFNNLEGVRRGSPVRLVRTTRSLRMGNQLLGRVIDARGRCIDGRPQPLLEHRRPLQRDPVPATERPRIEEPLATGVNAIDGMLTCGRGQRLGIFAGSGVGKSVLMGMMARYTNAEVSVIGLIGERGREVNEFIQRELGSEGLTRSVIVVATSNDPALLRVQAAYTATALAEFFRDQGKDVLLIMDSITRFSLAQREIGLSVGEPPTTRGFPPSVFAQMPRLVERAGRTRQGSITAFYSVLVEGDDENEPVADTMRGLLDGHVWLSRRMAERGHFPAIDVLRSISRLMNDVVSAEYRAAVMQIRRLLSVLHENEDLLTIGAYRAGTNRDLDVAVAMREEIFDLLRQAQTDQMPLPEIQAAFQRLSEKCSKLLQDNGPRLTKPS